MVDLTNCYTVLVYILILVIQVIYNLYNKYSVSNEILLGSFVGQFIRKFRYHIYNRLMPTTGYD